MQPAQIPIPRGFVSMSSGWSFENSNLMVKKIQVFFHPCVGELSQQGQLAGQMYFFSYQRRSVR